jgi:hypothetical protein
MASRQLEGVCDTLFLDFTDPLDDLESEGFVETNAPLKVLARDAHVLKVIDNP